MIELFQITGSASFAARAALEEAGVDYTPVDVHPRRRDETPGFAEVNPLRRVPAIRDGAVTVYETAAVLLYIAERFPAAELAPLPGEPHRGAFLRWLAWLSNTLHGAFTPVDAPHHLTDEPAAHDGIRRTARAKLEAIAEYLEGELQGRTWCVERFSVADIYLYMLVGWQSYSDGNVLGGRALTGHYARVGARAAIARARALDDLDERLQRIHPELRAGRPI